MIAVLRTVVVTVDTSLSIVSRFLPEVRCSRNDELHTFYDKGLFQVALLEKSTREVIHTGKLRKGTSFRCCWFLFTVYRRLRYLPSCSKEVQATLFPRVLVQVAV